LRKRLQTSEEIEALRGIAARIDRLVSPRHGDNHTNSQTFFSRKQQAMVYVPVYNAPAKKRSAVFTAASRSCFLN
jgi:hypothetical protein